MKNLGLLPIRSTHVATPSGVERRGLYPAKLQFPGTTISALTYNEVVGVNLSNQDYIALIGRDALVQMVLVFNGPGGLVTLAF